VTLTPQHSTTLETLSPEHMRTHQSDKNGLLVFDCWLVPCAPCPPQCLAFHLICALTGYVAHCCVPSFFPCSAHSPLVLLLQLLLLLACAMVVAGVGLEFVVALLRVLPRPVLTDHLHDYDCDHQSAPL